MFPKSVQHQASANQSSILCAVLICTRLMVKAPRLPTTLMFCLISCDSCVICNIQLNKFVRQTRAVKTLKLLQGKTFALPPKFAKVLSTKLSWHLECTGGGGFPTKFRIGVCCTLFQNGTVGYTNFCANHILG